MKETQAQIVQVGTLKDFLAEIPLTTKSSVSTSNRPVVRLSLVEQLTPRTYGQGKRSFVVPAKTITLHLQGTNPQGEIVWLCESHEVTWCSDGPAFSTDTGEAPAPHPRSLAASESQKRSGRKLPRHLEPPDPDQS